MATPKASITTTAKPVVAPVVKAGRKKPVRKSPALKDFPNKLAWLKAMTAYEESAATVASAAKVIRLDKRIDAKQKVVDDLIKEIAKLEDERDMLDHVLVEPTAGTVGT